MQRCANNLVRNTFKRCKYLGSLNRNSLSLGQLNVESTLLAAPPCLKYVTKAAQEPFLNGSSSVYVEEMYLAWKQDPKSVHKSWDAFFKASAAGLQPGLAYQPPPYLASHLAASQPSHSSETDLVSHQHIDDHLSVQAIIRSYQVRSRFGESIRNVRSWCVALRCEP